MSSSSGTLNIVILLRNVEHCHPLAATMRSDRAQANNSIGFYPRIQVDTTSSGAVGQVGGVLFTETIASQRGVITQLRTEAREDLIVAALNSAELTQQVRAMQSKWHWSGEGGWHALGGAGSLELTRLELDLRWLEQRIRQPVALTCAVLTGVTDDSSNLGEQCHGLVTVIDLALNVIELDAHRRPSQVAHRTTPAPAPAALTLSELADILSTLLTSPDVALTLSDRLL